MAAGTPIPPIAAVTGIAAFDTGCRAPCGAVASTISLAASAKKGHSDVADDERGKTGVATG